MIKFKNQTSNNTISSDIIKDLIDTLPATKSPIFKTKNFTIRDLRADCSQIDKIISY